MTTKPANNAPVSPWKPYSDSVGRRLRSRGGLLVLAAIALGLGAALNWSWLVAAGIAPILITLLPCAAMCALGLCMNQDMNSSTTSDAPSDATAEPSDAPVAQLQGRRSSCDVERPESDRRPADASER